MIKIVKKLYQKNPAKMKTNELNKLFTKKSKYIEIKIK